MTNSFSKLWPWFFFAAAFESLLAVIALLLVPSESGLSLARLGVRLVTATLPGPDPALTDLVSGHDVVYHVAGATKGVTYEDFRRGNVMPTQNLLDACRAKGVKRLILDRMEAVRP